MLLTIPWAVGIYLGRRDLDSQTGEAASIVLPNGRKKPILTHFSLTTNVVTVLDDIPMAAKIMMLSSISYWIIQFPAFFYNSDKDHGAYHERPYAMIGFIVTLAAFLGYCAYQLLSAMREEQVRRQVQAQRKQMWLKSLNSKYGAEMFQEQIFHKHDKDGSGTMDAKELSNALMELGLKLDRRDVQQILESMDIGDPNDPASAGDGKLTLHEFKTAISQWFRHDHRTGESTFVGPNNNHAIPINGIESPLLPSQGGPAQPPARQASLNKRNSVMRAPSQPPVDGAERKEESKEESKEDEEEEEEEEQFWELTDRQLLMNASLILLLATAVVSFFSDPMVDVISAFGKTLNISPFYISFVITPIASNASEVIAGLIFARKKTNESISLCLASLYGAATMNNTLALCIFMALVYFRHLSWSFSAEVLTVCIVNVVVGLNGLRSTVYMWQAVLVCSMYPFALLFVYLMENVAGLD
eukprot:TRINITY_DN588_c0_g2_i1.p1 TRINITY_DN588_c0_g2~~TRINITY_DN588_c0_g2_i1.p1  ORF type:complete len:472 (+),score=186.00 TRINITY_DN588_c0_g2_i1:277-1692(+)